MKTKKLLDLIWMSVFVGMFVFPYGCKKSNNDNAPVTLKKEYAWAVGDRDSTNYGMILFSKDCGATWQRQGEGSAALLNADLTDVWAIDSLTVWAVGMENLILKTTDGGKTWTRITPPVIRQDISLFSISVAEKKYIWISGVPGIVYNSKDGGNTWSVFDSAFFQHGIMQGVWAVTPNIIYVAGGVEYKAARGFIARTSDGGLTWDTIPPPNDYNRFEWISVKSYGQDDIVVYGQTSHYVYSHDGGITWKSDSVSGTGGMGGADINCLTMLDAQTWWGAFDYDGIFQTTNAGATWTKQTCPGGGGMWLFGIDYYDRNHAVIVGQASSSYTGKIVTTANGGNLWTLTYPCRTWLNKVSFIKN
jgi:photosystem II stability/assembly factor-like uncharacterized protein